VTPRPFDAGSYLAWNATERPDEAAVIDADRSLSFRELAGRVGAICRELKRRGAGPGTSVGVRLPNVWEYVALEIAIPHTGGVIVPLPLSLGEAELRWAVERSGARFVIDDRDVDGWRRLEAAELPPSPPADASRIVEIALTSGTTGMPKLASLTAGLKQATYEGFTARLQIGAGSRVLPMTPLTQGIGGMCLYGLRNGAGLVMLHEPRFTPEHVLGLVRRHRPTHLVGVPTNIIRLLDHEAFPQPGEVAVTAVAGAPMPPDVARRWEGLTGSRVCGFYGSMDAGQLAVASPDDPAEKRWESVGRPHDIVEVRITDEGEICGRGPTVQEHYWGEDRGPYSDDGWAHMGDLGRFDEDGYLYVVGRVKDLIIRGGNNINPHEVEAGLRSCRGVRDVCLIGRPDRELGERPVAFVVGDVSLTDLHAHLRGLGISRYKWPEELIPVPEIPLSGPGKVDRRALLGRLT
jgi:acyl-CoA synthetase (AMP-forming)/AMP-acid ligase II